MKASAAILALVTCGVYDPNPGWQTEWNGFPSLAGYDCALDVAREQAPCDLRWGGRIGWYSLPFECGSPPVQVAGCMPAGITLAVFAVGWREPVYSTALAHELGHYVLTACGLDGTTEAVVEAWSQGVNYTVQGRCLNASKPP